MRRDGEERGDSVRRDGEERGDGEERERGEVGDIFKFQEQQQN